MRQMYKDILIIGFALFSMFFGAGNLVFPPYLGLGCGPEWFLGFVCYYLADIGLALVAIFAVLRCGSPEAIFERTGKMPTTILMSAIILCIGPMLAIPRTAATTFEMSITPFAPEFSPVLFSVIFFAIVLLLSIKESAVVDIVGKILTPALLIGLIIMIIVGMINPLGQISSSVMVENIPVTGIDAGYQTMDVLAAAVFGIIILKSAHDKGYTDQKKQHKVVAGAGIVAGIGLLIVYMGLTYLGATVSETYDLTVPRASLVIAIVKGLMGSTGMIVVAVVVALACITTAVALVSAASEYFSTLSKGRVSYKALVVGICVFSAVVSNFGLDQIVSIAAPILSIVYPPTLILTILSLFGHKIKSDMVFKFAAVGALIISVLGVIAGFGVQIGFLAHLPLASIGFGWLVPALVFAAIGWAIDRFALARNN